MVQHPVVTQRIIAKVGIYTTAGVAMSWKTPYPYLDWALASVDAPDDVHTTIQSDNDVTLVPFFDDNGNYLPLSATVSQIATNYRTAIANYLENRRIPTGWITGEMTLGFVLKTIWKYLEIADKIQDDYPNLDLSMTVGQIPAAQRSRIIAWMDNNGISREGITTASTIRQVLQRIVRDYSFPALVEFGFALL